VAIYSIMAAQRNTAQIQLGTELTTDLWTLQVYGIGRSGFKTATSEIWSIKPHLLSFHLY